MKGIALYSGDAVEIGEEVIDDDVIRLQQIVQRGIVFEQVGKGFIDLVLRRKLGAVVEARKFRTVHFKKIKPVHAEPLGDQALHEVTRSGIVEQACGLRGEDLGLHQCTLLRQLEQDLVRRGAPEEIGEAGKCCQWYSTGILFRFVHLLK